MRKDAHKMYALLDRIVLYVEIVLAVGLMIGGAMAIWCSLCEIWAADGALNNPVMQMQVDLSRPGEYSAPFEHTRRVFPGLWWMLQVDPWPYRENETSPLSNLTADLRLEDDSGKTMWQENDVKGEEIEHTYRRNGIEIQSLEGGTYRFVLVVRTGASDLAGRKQTLSARYLVPRGYPEMARILLLAGIGALVATVMLVVFALRHRRPPKRPA